MVPSKTYLKFKETRSQEDLNTLNKYLKRLSEISSKLNNDALELSDEEEHAEIIDYYIDLLEEPETLYENAEQTINLLKFLIK
jgi:hypothetical protein